MIATVTISDLQENDIVKNPFSETTQLNSRDAARLDFGQMNLQISFPDEQGKYNDIVCMFPALLNNVRFPTAYADP